MLAEECKSVNHPLFPPREFNDSKQLTEAKRDSLFASINKDTRMGFVAEILSAHFITTGMLSRQATGGALPPIFPHITPTGMLYRQANQGSVGRPGHNMASLWTGGLSLTHPHPSPSTPPPPS